MPQSYFIEAVKPTIKPQMTSMTVPNSSKKKLEYKIIQVNSVLRFVDKTICRTVCITKFKFSTGGNS